LEERTQSNARGKSKAGSDQNFNKGADALLEHVYLPAATIFLYARVEEKVEKNEAKRSVESR
jgi:hypothetical protein